MNLATTQERYSFVNFHGLRVTFPITHIFFKINIAHRHPHQMAARQHGFYQAFKELTDIRPALAYHSTFFKALGNIDFIYPLVA